MDSESNLFLFQELTSKLTGFWLKEVKNLLCLEVPGSNSNFFYFYVSARCLRMLELNLDGMSDLVLLVAC